MNTPLVVPVPTRIDLTFSALRSAGQMAFMPFITAGDPDMATTGALIRELASRGVDLIVDAFTDADVQVRILAATVSENLSDPRSLRALSHMAESDVDAKARERARSVLAKLSR